MKYRNIFWGVILITLGALFILKNLDIIYFNWYAIFRLWPLLLILIGISILPVKNTIKLILSFLAIILAITFIFSSPYSRYHYFNFRCDRNHSYYDNDLKEQYFYESYDSSINLAVLKIDAAAGSFKIKGETDNLLDFEKEGNIGPYRFSSQDFDNKKVLKLNIKNTFFKLGNIKNNVYIKLNPEPVWEFDFDAGAAKLDLDLIPFKTKKITIDGGASSINIKLGDKYNYTKLDIDAGASSINIKIPEESGCEVHTSSVLSSRNLRGFNKIKKGFYKTSNFENSINKIYIDIDVAVSSLKVSRY